MNSFARAAGASLAKSDPVDQEVEIVSHQHHHKGYAIDGNATRTDDGRYRAQAILVTLGNQRPRSQRFIDLESFANEDDARERAIAVARAWIDEEESNTHALMLPTDLAPLS